MPTNKKPTIIRLPADMVRKLKIIAVTENRSMNNFVEFVLKKAISDYESANGEIYLAPEEEDY